MAFVLHGRLHPRIRGTGAASVDDNGMPIFDNAIIDIEYTAEWGRPALTQAARVTIDYGSEALVIANGRNWLSNGSPIASGTVNQPALFPQIAINYDLCLLNHPGSSLASIHKHDQLKPVCRGQQRPDHIDRGCGESPVRRRKCRRGIRQLQHGRYLVLGGSSCKVLDALHSDFRDDSRRRLQQRHLEHGMARGHGRLGHSQSAPIICQRFQRHSVCG